MMPLKKDKGGGYKIRQARFRMKKSHKELEDEMAAWQRASAELFVNFERDLILEQQVIIVENERSLDGN